ncbi:MAG: hypothetical protein ACI9KN_000704 [Gammaproteobacteria bacterium]|jgi:hypothetical protein
MSDAIVNLQKINISLLNLKTLVIITAMHPRLKTIFSQLLVLIMVIGSFQSALAINFSQNMHGEESQVSQMFLSEAHGMQVASDELSDHLEENASHTDCADHCNLTFLQNIHANPQVTRSKIKQLFVAVNSTFSSHYPHLLIRPPKT